MENPEIDRRRLCQSLLREARKRAKEKNLEFDLRLADLPPFDKCPVLGLELKRHKNNLDHGSPSLDRIDSAKGYIKGNVRVVSWKINQLKSNLTLEQVKRLADYMEGKI